MATILITGCDTGLGLEFARQYAGDGHRVIATCLDPSGAKEAAAISGNIELVGLDVTDHAAIAEWSGAAYGATFFSAALCAPLWGRLADLYGRKLMLIRASLGMAVAMSLIGMAQNVWQLVALRLLAGFLGGYASGSIVLVATQTPKSRSIRGRTRLQRARLSAKTIRNSWLSYQPSVRLTQGLREGLGADADRSSKAGCISMRRSKMNPSIRCCSARYAIDD